MTGSTIVEMQAEDACPSVGKLGVTEVAAIPLGQIGADSLGCRVGVAVTGKGTAVATVALAAVELG